ncbi:MAG: hypothetical protein RLZZ142_2154 [Verrucomicrobiota bacterium]
MNSEELLGRYLAGGCTDAEVHALQEALKQDAALRHKYLDYLNLDLALETRVDMTEQPAPARRSASADSAQRVRSSFGWAWGIAAAVAVLVGVGVVWGGRWGNFGESYATVVECPGVEQWRVGKRLRGGRYAIGAGTVDLVTSRGARVVIEAPAEFRFESEQRLILSRGRLSAEVPPAAKGFTVVTRSGDAVDLGTRFGVDVPSKGAAEVHVFEGEVVERSARGGQRQSVKGGEAVVMNQGAGAVRELRNAAFIRREEVGRLSAALTAGQRARAAAALGALRRDPALIALVEFESGRVGAGVYREVQGRWPGSKALEFCNPGDHLKLDAGGGRTWPELTFAAWVRLDRVGGGRIQSLFHTDGWDRKNPGQIHWSVTPFGTMWLVCLPFQKHAVNEEMTPRLPEEGRWTHLVSVYDAPRHLLRHYLDGKLGLEMTLSGAAPAVLGPAEIGNWDLYDRKLSGRLDELVLMGRAMEEREVAALFEAGNPYR